MTDEDLAELISALRTARAEASDIEAKRATNDLPRSVRNTLSSFSNAHGGGVLVLGLDESDGFAATGVADPAHISSALADQCASQFEPPVRALIGVHTFEGAQLVVAEVPEIDARQKPCYYIGAGMANGSYIRTADGDYKLSPYEVQMLVASRGQPREDELPVSGATLEDLDPALVDALLSRVRSLRPGFEGTAISQALERLRVLVRQPDGLAPSLAGLLALGSAPQRFLPQVNLTFVHYPTTTGADVVTGERFVDSRSFDGPIPVIVRDALETVRRNMRRRSVVQGVGRTDIWEYPEPALREAVVNAMVHRDLSAESLGTQVQIEMYPDRLVVRNPGGLFGPVTVARLGEEGVSSARNATLLRILEDVVIPGEQGPVCENRGSGVKVMLASLRAAGMSLPEFADRISTFEVSFPNHTLLDEPTVQWLEALGQTGLSESQCVALALLRERRIITNATYRLSTGVDSRVATSELQDLVAREVIEQSGVRRWASYTLTENALAARTRRGRPSPADRRAEVLQALGSETRSSAEIVAATGLRPQTVRKWLLTLRQEGKIEIIGRPQSNAAKYRSLIPVDLPATQLTLELGGMERPEENGAT